MGFAGFVKRKMRGTGSCGYVQENNYSGPMGFKEGSEDMIVSIVSKNWWISGTK